MASGNIPGESNAWMVRTPCIVFFVVTPIFIGIRLWSRIARRSGIGWDDWTILLSFSCTLVVQILMMISCHYGFGQHIRNLSTDNKLMALKLFYVAQIFYKLTINLTKISIILLYLRIFLQKWFRICCYALGGIIGAYMVATTASSIWQCSPIEGAWNRAIGPKCIDLTKNWHANAGFSISTDILILMLPMQPVWSSNLPVMQKRALMIVFALGGFVTITSILRSTTLSFSTKTPDTTYNITSTLWTMIEENVALICACLPMCRMPLSYMFPSAFASKLASSSKRYGSDHYPSSTQRSHDPTASWKPYVGPRKAEGFCQTSAMRSGDAASEEYILDPLDSHGNSTTANSPTAPDSVKDTAMIRKTTRYNVSYETDTSGKI